jgi:hypothetical protein
MWSESKRPWSQDKHGCLSWPITAQRAGHGSFTSCPSSTITVAYWSPWSPSADDNCIRHTPQSALHRAIAKHHGTYAGPSSAKRRSRNCTCSPPSCAREPVKQPQAHTHLQPRYHHHHHVHLTATAAQSASTTQHTCINALHKLGKRHTWGALSTHMQYHAPKHLPTAAKVQAGLLPPEVQSIKGCQQHSTNSLARARQKCAQGPHEQPSQITCSVPQACPKKRKDSHGKRHAQCSTCTGTTKPVRRGHRPNTAPWPP